MARRMKDSGVAWIGQVPAGWEMRRNKYLFLEHKNIVGNESQNLQLLSLTTHGIVKKSAEDIGGKKPESYDTYQTVKAGQLVLCLFDLDCSAVFSGYCKYNGMISPAYKVFDGTDDIDLSYYSYWFEFVFVNRKYKQYSKNVRFSLGIDDFGALYSPRPPLAEQMKIAEFLDRECGKLDALVEKVKEQIAQLEACKKSIITEAVTRGNRKMARLKNVATIFGRIGYRGYTTEDIVGEGEGALSLSPSNIKDGYIDYSNRTYISTFKYEESPEIKVFNGDIILVKTGSSYGKSCIVENLPCCATINPQLAVIKQIKCNTRFLYYILQTPSIRNQAELTVVGGTIPTMAQSKMGNWTIPFPPLAEQKEIAEYLDKKCGKIDGLIKKSKEQLEKLAEYKKSLIYEYVTGKKEVSA